MQVFLEFHRVFFRKVYFDEQKRFVCIVCIRTKLHNYVRDCQAKMFFKASTPAGHVLDDGGDEAVGSRDGHGDVHVCHHLNGNGTKN